MRNQADPSSAHLTCCDPVTRSSRKQELLSPSEQMELWVDHNWWSVLNFADGKGRPSSGLVVSLNIPGSDTVEIRCFPSRQMSHWALVPDQYPAKKGLCMTTSTSTTSVWMQSPGASSCEYILVPWSSSMTTETSNDSSAGGSEGPLWTSFGEALLIRRWYSSMSAVAGKKYVRNVVAGNDGEYGRYVQETKCKRCAEINIASTILQLSFYSYSNPSKIRSRRIENHTFSAIRKFV